MAVCVRHRNLGWFSPKSKGPQGLLNAPTPITLDFGSLGDPSGQEASTAWFPRQPVTLQLAKGPSIWLCVSFLIPNS